MLSETLTSRPTMNLLVIDDDSITADALEVLLLRQGDLVTKAATAEQAKDYLSVRRPDAVLLDLDLPGDVEGLHHHLESLPVVVLTAHPDWLPKFKVAAVLRKPQSSEVIRKALLDAAIAALEAKPAT